MTSFNRNKAKCGGGKIFPIATPSGNIMRRANQKSRVWPKPKPKNLGERPTALTSEVKKTKVE